MVSHEGSLLCEGGCPLLAGWREAHLACGSDELVLVFGYILVFQTGHQVWECL